MALEMYSGRPEKKDTTSSMILSWASKASSWLFGNQVTKMSASIFPGIGFLKRYRPEGYVSLISSLTPFSSRICRSWTVEITLTNGKRMKTYWSSSRFTICGKKMRVFVMVVPVVKLKKGASRNQRMAEASCQASFRIVSLLKASMVLSIESSAGESWLEQHLVFQKEECSCRRKTLYWRAEEKYGVYSSGQIQRKPGQQRAGQHIIMPVDGGV